MTTGSVVAGSVVAGSVVAGSVVAGSVVAGSVVAGSVVAGSVVAGSVVAGSVVVGSVVGSGVERVAATSPSRRHAVAVVDSAATRTQPSATRMAEWRRDVMPTTVPDRCERTMKRIGSTTQRTAMTTLPTLRPVST
ncbi:MAG: hypothetical protein U0Q03_06050 [Acidimicrobiales bacterium]